VAGERAASSAQRPRLAGVSIAEAPGVRVSSGAIPGDPANPNTRVMLHAHAYVNVSAPCISSRPLTVYGTLAG
jgi:hypothetical protein